MGPQKNGKKKLDGVERPIEGCQGKEEIGEPIFPWGNLANQSVGVREQSGTCSFPVVFFVDFFARFQRCDKPLGASPSGS